MLIVDGAAERRNKENQMNEQMAALTFGVEIETSGASTDRVAAIVAAAIPGSTVRRDGGYYGKFAVVMADGRAWTVMTDASIHGTGAEVVSPILKGNADVELLQTIVRALRAAGLKSSADVGCGIHVHVGVGHLPVAALGRIAKLATRADAIIRRSVSVSASRARWCEPVAAERAEALGRARTRDAFAAVWYGTRAAHSLSSRIATHYDSSRYVGANFHSYFYTNRGTVEFRYFDGTLHAGKVRAYVSLCLGLVASAAAAGSMSTKALRMPETRAQARGTFLQRVRPERSLGLQRPVAALRGVGFRVRARDGGPEGGVSRAKRSAGGALVFAFGSNLSVAQMARRCPGAIEVARARLREHRLLFAGFSRSWGGAVATVVPDPKRSVRGSVYRLSYAELDRLDTYEGAPWCYERVSVEVELFGGKLPKRARAELYVKVDPTPGCPSRAYLEAIAEGYTRHGYTLDALVRAAMDSAAAAAQMDALAAIAAVRGAA